MHIPKACGTSLAASLGAALSPAVTVGGFDHVLFGGFAAFETIDGEVRRQIFDDAAALPRKADLVAGHLAWSTLSAAYPDGQMVTLLREPVTRVMSLWMFWRRHTDALLAPWGEWADYVRHSRLPLAEFLGETRIAAQTDNVALRMLLWPHALIPAAGFIEPAHDRVLLRLAKARLDGFGFAGAVEAPEVWERLGTWLGRTLAAERRNVTEDMPPDMRAPLAAQLGADCLDLLDARSRLDLALWESVYSARHRGVDRVRRVTILRHVARYSALMAAGA